MTNICQIFSLTCLTNNDRKMHGEPMRRRVAGRKGENMKDNTYLYGRPPCTGAAINLYLSDRRRDMCLPAFQNNYLKMHGKTRIREVAGRKRKRTRYNHFSKNIKNEIRFYFKRKRKGIKHKRNRRNNEYQISI